MTGCDRLKREVLTGKHLLGEVPDQRVKRVNVSPKPTVLIDTREQLPLRITAYPTQEATLPVGDYGIEGFSDWGNPQFIAERKSLSDLIGSLTFERERFMRECQKLRQFRFAALIIEAERRSIEAGLYRSEATPASILGSLAALEVRTGLHVIYSGDAAGAAVDLERLVRVFCHGIEKDFARLRVAFRGSTECRNSKPIASKQVTKMRPLLGQQRASGRA